MTVAVFQSVAIPGCGWTSEVFPSKLPLSSKLPPVGGRGRSERMLWGHKGAYGIEEKSAQRGLGPRRAFKCGEAQRDVSADVEHKVFWRCRGAAALIGRKPVERVGIFIREDGAGGSIEYRDILRPPFNVPVQ